MSDLRQLAEEALLWVDTPPSASEVGDEFIRDLARGLLALLDVAEAAKAFVESFAVPPRNNDPFHANEWQLRDALARLVDRVAG